MSKAARLESWLREHGSPVLDLHAFEELRRLLHPVSESTLRRMLRSTGAALHPLVAGVDQDNPEALGVSLSNLAAVYESGPPEVRRLAREIVITAKDHARLAARNPRVREEKRRLKQEMVETMRVWLENPAVFTLWSRLRDRSRKLD